MSTTHMLMLSSDLPEKEVRSLAREIESLLAGHATELVCSDVELAMESLSELDGREISEDIVSEIFSHFCVGK